MMEAKDPAQVRRFKVACMAKSEKNISRFIQRNSNVLNELVDSVIADIQSRDVEAILESSYKLFSAASSFGRADISNLADLLHRMMRNPVFATSNDVLDVFEAGMVEMIGFDAPLLEAEKVILDRIYAALRANNRKDIS